MRSVLVVGLVITLLAPVDAAPLRRSRAPLGHLRHSQRAIVPETVPGGVPRDYPASRGFAVPGWTDEQTRYWLDSASGPKG